MCGEHWRQLPPELQYRIFEMLERPLELAAALRAARHVLAWRRTVFAR